MVQQVRAALIELLRNEQYEVGACLPSEQELAERFEVSRPTIREVLKSLVQAGLLDCRHGRGYFVLSRDAMIHKPITQLQSVTELMDDMGYSVENRVLCLSEEQPTPQVRRELQLDEQQTILRLERVRRSQGQSLIYSIDIFSRSLIAGPWQEQDWSGSLLHLFGEQKVHIASSRTTMRAAALPPDLCERIEVPANTAWLCMEQVNMTGASKPILFSQDYHRGDCFEFYVTRRRF